MVHGNTGDTNITCTSSTTIVIVGSQSGTSRTFFGNANANARLGLTQTEFGLYEILFHFEALLHNNILCKHPLYCAIYCTILPVIAPPPPSQF